MTSQIPFFSTAAANAGVDLHASIQRVLARQWFVLGEEVAAFERDFAQYCGAAACVALANGTDALELALRAVGVGPGDRVLLAANAGFYGSTAVRLVGAQPHYVDVDPATLTLTQEGIAKALEGAAAKVAIVTHLYGQLAPIEAIAATCRSAGTLLIEDCAQAHGASRGGQRAGSFGDIGCFSFYPTKNLGALGDGGAVTCASDAVAGRIRALRQYGWTTKYRNTLPGGRNSRLDELQAAVLNDKLPHLDAANEARRAIARQYTQLLAGLPLQLPASCGEDHVAHLYVVRTPQRDRLRTHLAACGIASDVHYPVADHRQAVWPLPDVVLPVTEAACEQVLSLPCYPNMPSAHLDAVAAAVTEFFASTA